MSDIELVREVYTAMAARDVGRRFELIDPTFVVTQDPALPWGGRHVGHNVAFVPFKNARPAGPPREFLSGFMMSPDQKDVWGRPVGLLQLPDGSLLMTDDGGKKIWRIAFRGSGAPTAQR